MTNPPQSNKEIMEYISGQKEATTQALIGTLRYLRDELPNGNQITQVIASYLDLCNNQVQRSEASPHEKQGFHNGVKHLQDGLNKKYDPPNNP